MEGANQRRGDGLEVRASAQQEELAHGDRCPLGNRGAVAPTTELLGHAAQRGVDLLASKELASEDAALEQRERSVQVAIAAQEIGHRHGVVDRKSTRLNSSHA